MDEARFTVAHAGPHVTVQDGGRPGCMRFGVPASGPMDRKALMIANAALGNPLAAPGVEVSRGGLALECTAGQVTLAIAGGGFIVERAGLRLGAWGVLTVAAGQRLTIRPGPWGSWCCIAFAGRLDCGQWLGSAATHAFSGLGGGRLQAGQHLRVADPRALPLHEGAIPCPVWARPRHHLHAVAGPQDHVFPPIALDLLQTHAFVVTDAADRMGTRLAGPSLAPEAALSLPSEPVLRGSVQVAGDGVATVLLADHQTTGGYPKIATLLSDDTDGFAQLRPKQPVRFHLITAEMAVAMARQRARSLARWLDNFSHDRRMPTG